MDYKYIEQLLERYWNCETTPEEEDILRTFFSQKEVPAHLLRYRSLFVYEQTIKKAKLSDDFDEKILKLIESEEAPVKAKTISFTQRMRPLFKAAAVIAILLTLGNAAQHSFTQENAQKEYNYDHYQDTYKDPEVAYDQVSYALQMVARGLNDSVISDSTAALNSQVIGKDR